MRGGVEAWGCHETAVHGGLKGVELIDCLCVYILRTIGGARAVVIYLECRIAGLQKQHRRHAASTTHPTLDRRSA